MPDICCICGKIGEDGAFDDVNEIDFELLCPKCKDARCSNCVSLTKQIAKNKTYKCAGNHKNILDINKQVCEYWEYKY